MSQLKLPPYAITTRASQSLYPCQLNAGLKSRTVAVGIDVLSGGNRFCYDPWDLYNERPRVISSPCAAIFGKVGKGKSSLVKTYSGRQLLFGTWVGVMDPKGEYDNWARYFGVTTIRPRPGGTVCINPLDAGPLGLTDPEELRVRRIEMICALAASRMLVEPDAEDANAIGFALEEITQKTTNPTLGDIVRLLLHPTVWMADKLATTVTALAAKVRPTAQALNRLVTGDLAGMFDGQTNINIDWDGPGIVVDLSAVHGTPACAPVMICVGAWLAQAVTRTDGRHRMLILDELWAILHLVSVTRWLRGLEKLSRKYGIALWYVLHRLSDLAGSSSAGSEAREQAEGLLKDVETLVLYPQDPSEATALVSMLGLRESVAHLVTQRLPDHRALWLVGKKAAVVHHVMTRSEFSYSQTDDAMKVA